ncbi:hypothetical protein NEIPOLOT_00672 [Neisseria polysaccharea ATCC 43768]|nr:hypothetical protein NEIPOLOT_00672 [Neisseria polysaccharea ATCC 43768]
MMGYHIRIINTSKKISDENKILKNKENLSIFLRENLIIMKVATRWVKYIFMTQTMRKAFFFMMGKNCLQLPQAMIYYHQ